MKDSLKSKSIIAVVWDILGSLSTQGIQFVISIILARILTPADFGLIGMSMVIIAISQIFIDLGFSSALIQNDNNAKSTYDSVFVLNVVMGILLCALCFLLARPIGKYYGHEEISYIVMILAPSLIISSFNYIQLAILKRELKFKELNIRLLFSGIVSGVVAIGLAYSGLKFYALAFQVVIFQIISSIILWNVSEWRPSFSFSITEIKKLWNFSFYIFLGQTMNQVINKLDALVIGKLFSPATLGFFTRSESLNSLLVNLSSGSLSKVFFPAMSKIQNDKEKFKRAFIQVVSLSSLLAFFFSGILIISSEFLIIGLFGEKWKPSVLIFQILMLKMFCYPISVIIVNAFKALGLAKLDFYYGLFRKFIRLIPFGVAILYGFEPFLYSLVIVVIVGTLFNNVIAAKHLEVPLKEQIVKIYQYSIYFIISITIAYYLGQFIEYEWLSVIIQNLVYIICFIFMIKVFNRRIYNTLISESTNLFQILKLKFA